MQLLDAEITFALGTKQSTKSRTYRGPLLWTLLLRYAAIDPTKPKPEVRQVIWVTGNDGYTAAIAMGEVSPNFEGKKVILADEVDGHSLPPGTFRLVVPGDLRGERSVRDVVEISVDQPH
jgi:hypothetical protein